MSLTNLSLMAVICKACGSNQNLQLFISISDAFSVLSANNLGYLTQISLL